MDKELEDLMQYSEGQKLIEKIATGPRKYGSSNKEDIRLTVKLKDIKLNLIALSRCKARSAELEKMLELNYSSILQLELSESYKREYDMFLEVIRGIVGYADINPIVARNVVVQHRNNIDKIIDWLITGKVPT